MENADVSETEVKNFKALLDYLKKLSEDGVTSLIEKQVKWMLDNSLDFFSHLVLEDSFPEITRLTINKKVLNGKNKRIKEIKYLKYPPADKVKTYGRCNQPGQSVLYSAFSEMTVLNELQPRKGDLITTSKWRLKDGQTIMFCPIFRNQPEEEDVLNPRTFEIFNQFEDGKIEAIYYPSVKERLSFENLAIKPEVFDTKYELIEVKDSVIRMDTSKGEGGYIMDGLSVCKSFDYAAGKILWDNKVDQSKERIAQLKSLYQVDFE